MYIRNRGIHLVELMIAIALVSILIVPMVSLLYSMRGSSYAKSTPVWYDKFLSVDDDFHTAFKLKDSAGKKSCRDFKWQNAIITEPVYEGSVSLSQKMGTSSLPTAISVLGKYLLFTANSSSTTMPDFFVMRVNSGNFSILSVLDTGPGVADMFLSGYTAYVADTSVKDQAKAIDLFDPEHPVVGRAYLFPGSNSTTNPISKRLITYGPLLIIGTEKSTLPEIEAFDIKTGALMGSINTEFGINRLLAMGERLVVLGPTDPEVNVYDLNFQKIDSFDAPGGSGNGRSLDVVGERLMFGRTKGGNELNLLSSISSIQQVLQSQKVSASIDNIIADINHVLVFTSDSARELLVFEPVRDRYGNVTALNKVSEFNLPARTADAVCDGNKLYVALQSQAIPFIIISS